MLVPFAEPRLVLFSALDTAAGMFTVAFFLAEIACEGVVLFVQVQHAVVAFEPRRVNMISAVPVSVKTSPWSSVVVL